MLRWGRMEGMGLGETRRDEFWGKLGGMGFGAGDQLPF